MVASNYRGKVPLPLYIKLNNMLPRGPEENEAAWLQRVKHDPFGKQMLRSTFEDFQDELQQAVARRTMAMSEAQRIGLEAERQLGKKMLESGATVLQAAPTLIRQSADRGRLTTTIAQRYRDELLEQFVASNRTPQNGNIFWNGISELALAKLVDKWNTELPDEAKLGQLEATTSARYVNHQFKWEKGGVFEKYFNEVSDRLGKVRVGTSPQSCGAACAIPPSSRRRNCQRCSRGWKTSSRTRRNRVSPTSIRDGSGDHWFALLCSAVALHGLAHEAPIYHDGRYVIGICQ
jgi:hypothetical protein